MTDWSRIVEEHGGIVWKTVRRLVSDDHDAADCFQETFMSALKYSQTGVVKNWPGLLKRLATVRASIGWKRMRTETLPLSGDVAAAPSGRSQLPLAAAVEHELFDRLREGLATLPADQAEACCLRFLEGLSYDEIAEELRVTVNHVGVLLHRAKASLQNRLAAFAPTSNAEGKVEHESF